MASSYSFDAANSSSTVVVFENQSGISQANSPTFLLSNICNLVAMHLNLTNYLLWHFQLESVLIAHLLFGIIDRFVPHPTKFNEDVTPSSTPNPALSMWITYEP